VKMPRNTTLQ